MGPRPPCQNMRRSPFISILSVSRSKFAEVLSWGARCALDLAQTAARGTDRPEQVLWHRGCWQPKPCHYRKGWVKSRSSLSNMAVASSSHPGMRKRLLMRLSSSQATLHALPRWVSVRERCWKLTFRDDRRLHAGVQCSKRSDDRAWTQKMISSSCPHPQLVNLADCWGRRIVRLTPLRTSTTASTASAEHS